MLAQPGAGAAEACMCLNGLITASGAPMPNCQCVAALMMPVPQ